MDHFFSHNHHNHMITAHLVHQHNHNVHASSHSAPPPPSGHRPPPPPISGMNPSHSHHGQPPMSSMLHRNPPPPMSGMSSSHSHTVHPPMSSMRHRNPPPPISQSMSRAPLPFSYTGNPLPPPVILNSYNQQPPIPVITTIPPTGNRIPFGGVRTFIVPPSPPTTTILLSSSSPAPVAYRRPSMLWNFLTLSGTALLFLFALTHGWGPLALAGIIGVGSYALYKSNQSSPANNPAPPASNTSAIAQNLDGGQGLINGVQHQPNLSQSQVPPSSNSASQPDAPPPDYQSSQGYTLQSSGYVPTPASAPPQFK